MRFFLKEKTVSEINLIKCDGPGCDKQADKDNWSSPTYHKLVWGGTDFEMSLGERDVFDFCSAKCLICFLSKLEEETQW
jgi:hypothetical protein